jgi:ribosomal protein S18
MERERSNRDHQDRDRGGDRDGAEGREGDSTRRRRPRPPIDLYLDYKDPETLKPFLTEGGRMVPCRMSRLSRGQQKILAQEVKRARQLALLPVSDRH